MSLRALVYGDVDLNVLDGSAVWLPAVCECLARSGVEVTVALKAPVIDDRLTGPLERLPGVRVIVPSAKLSPEEAVAAVVALDEPEPFDLILIRGLPLAQAMCEEPTVSGRLWTYLTDIPQAVSALTYADRTALMRICRASRRMLCQTPELRAYIETVVPSAQGKTAVLDPVIPGVDVVRPPEWSSPVRLVYSGKFAPLWATESMMRLPTLLAERGIEATVEAVGDKIHRDGDFAARMRPALESSPGVTWHGGMGRADAMAIVARSHIGLAYRAPELDASLELSTKLLEYGQLGVAPLLNRNPMHERLLGSDYPLFASSAQEAADRIAECLADPVRYDAARRAAMSASEHYTMDRAVERMSELLARAFPAAGRRTTNPAKRRILVASHDLKFLTGILDVLEADDRLEIRIDRWSSLAGHNPARSEELGAWADVVLCEWAGPNAVWFSHRKRAGQRLVTRLHRFELGGGWIPDIAGDELDAIVCVNDHYADLTAGQTGWQRGRIRVIPNAVDCAAFDRPKLPGASSRLGLIGIAPFRKRPDLALDVLAAIRRHDRRVTLSVKSRAPWEHPWIWRRPEERESYVDFYERVQSDPLVAGAVTFDDHGGDVSQWLERIGWLLSTSDDESFHLGPAEGMASGAIPAILSWPGSEGVYAAEYVHDSAADMAAAILAGIGDWTTASERARRAFPREFDLPHVAACWADLLLEH